MKNEKRVASAPGLNPRTLHSYNLRVYSLQGLKPWVGSIPLDQLYFLYNRCGVCTALNDGL